MLNAVITTNTQLTPADLLCMQLHFFTLSNAA